MLLSTLVPMSLTGIALTIVIHPRDTATQPYKRVLLTSLLKNIQRMGMRIKYVVSSQLLYLQVLENAGPENITYLNLLTQMPLFPGYGVLTIFWTSVDTYLHDVAKLRKS